jgi:hypothetical protein
MEIRELVMFATTFAGMAFGFGRQSGEIKTLRRDTDSIAKMHRETTELLSDIDRKLVRLEERLDSLRVVR